MSPAFGAAPISKTRLFLSPPDWADTKRKEPNRKTGTERASRMSKTQAQQARLRSLTMVK